MKINPCPEKFQLDLEKISLQSAEIIIPLIIELIKPKSIIDIGCGTGSWLSAFKKAGIKDFVGVDNEFIDEKILKIPKNRFIRFDLTKPFKINRRFDLVVSLEVAEHLPESSARNFIKSLVNLGPVIIFSAAIPYQGGVNHLNEQWPFYWQNYFKQFNYIAIDCLRFRLWNNKKVAWWYAQNIIIYVDKKSLPRYPSLKSLVNNQSPHLFSLVHPECFLNRVYNYPPKSIKYLSKLLLSTVINRVKI